MGELDKRALDRWIQDPGYPNNPQREEEPEDDSGTIAFIDVELLINGTNRKGGIIYSDPRGTIKKFKSIGDAQAWCLIAKKVLQKLK
jgi:hypothetical protein